MVPVLNVEWRGALRAVPVIERGTAPHLTFQMKSEACQTSSGLPRGMQVLFPKCISCIRDKVLNALCRSRSTYPYDNAARGLAESFRVSAMSHNDVRLPSCDLTLALTEARIGMALHWLHLYFGVQIREACLPLRARAARRMASGRRYHASARARACRSCQTDG